MKYVTAYVKVTSEFKPKVEVGPKGGFFYKDENGERVSLTKEEAEDLRAGKYKKKKNTDEDSGKSKNKKSKDDTKDNATDKGHEHEEKAAIAETAELEPKDVEDAIHEMASSRNWSEEEVQVAKEYTEKHFNDVLHENKKDFDDLWKSIKKFKKNNSKDEDEEDDKNNAKSLLKSSLATIAATSAGVVLSMTPVGMVLAGGLRAGAIDPKSMRNIYNDYVKASISSLKDSFDKGDALEEPDIEDSNARIAKEQQEQKTKEKEKDKSKDKDNDESSESKPDAETKDKKEAKNAKNSSKAKDKK